MKTVIKSTLAIALTALAMSCINETESDFDRIVKRDDAILADYVASKDLDATKTQIGY